jgi:hypothetical protein
VLLVFLHWIQASRFVVGGVDFDFDLRERCVGHAVIVQGWFPGGHLVVVLHR